MSMRNRPEWDVASNRMQFLRLYDLTLEQLVAAGLEHTANVQIVGAGDVRRGAREWASAPQPVDGLLTRDPDVVLMTTHADCVPLWLATGTGWVGLAHAGWRGIQAGILRSFVEAVPGAEREGLSLAAGPAICREHYEVGPDVAELFQADPVTAGAVSTDGNRFQLDLVEALRLQAEELGIELDTSMAICTWEHDFLSSWRRDGHPLTPMAAFITRRSR
jgi:YfiH family protein